MSTEASHWIFLGILNIPLYLGIGWLIFDDWSGFVDCLGLRKEFDWTSLFRTRTFEDSWEIFKLVAFCILCFAALLGEYRLFFVNKAHSKVSMLHLTNRSV